MVVFRNASTLNHRATFITAFLFQLIVFTHCHQQAENRDNEGRNRLRNAGSPYLREHADNPVDWYEWGPEALEKAKKENKPLIISIGYAACHWCHVMERESFMDTAVARIMNEHFVSIKIDREERPDIDQIYMQAAQLISGRGGWPLNAFALPDGQPFYAATYFPKEQWVNLLQQVIKSFKGDRENVVRQAAAVTQGIQSADLITAPADQARAHDKQTYESILSGYGSYVDEKNGGFSGAPKFPMPVVWESLLQHHYLTGTQQSLDWVVTTLDEMAMGGIYDHLGGGFARYATDDQWKIPHFEKMLYDNGQLVSVYAHAYQVTQKPLYAEIVAATLEFVRKELTSPEGGFYASLNADSEGEEGKYYVWTKTEIEAALTPEAAQWFTAFYQVTDSGNWEDGKNILFRRQSIEALAAQLKISEQEVIPLLRETKGKLLQQRRGRIPPSVDDKILVSWNALMLSGYLDAYAALGKASYLETAVTNASFLEKNMIRDSGKLWRNYKDGKASIDAFLDDYALLAHAFLKLYQATYDIHWLTVSRSITSYAIHHFRDPVSGMFFYTSDEAEGLVARKMETADNVIPSSNSVLATVLYQQGIYFALDSLTEMSTSMLHQVSREMETAGPYYANWVNLMGLITHEPYEVAVMGDQALDKSKRLRLHYLPTALFMGGQTENLPLLENKLAAGRTMIYVCRNRVCKLPVEDVDQAMAQLKANGPY